MRARRDTTLQRVGKNLRDARRSAQLSQDALSRRSGVNQATISRVEAGAREPGVTTLLRLADALETPVATLLEGLDDRSGC